MPGMGTTMNTVAKIIGTLVLLGLMAKFWLPLLLFIVAFVAFKYGLPAYRSQAAAHRAERAALAARADQQHQWVMQGDDRGVYGPTGAKLMCDIR
jgi:hypothetical protein